MSGSPTAPCSCASDRQVEINHQKFDDLSLTWNTVDPIGRNAWTVTGNDPMASTPLRWRKDACPRLAALGGERLCGVGLLRYTGSDMVGGMIAPTFAFADERVTIANGLDENLIDFGQPSPAFEMMWHTWEPLATSASSAQRSAAQRELCTERQPAERRSIANPT